MADGEVVPNETTVPLRPGVPGDETLEFRRTLGSAEDRRQVEAAVMELGPLEGRLS
uniref:hypothetical protein n=1 Tax=Paractinoplanes polyasparticus TaxID=2856853 RepID=UPI001C866CDE|nr:hypothetical protein [Actinoplanes polyasparticus]